MAMFHACQVINNKAEKNELYSKIEKFQFFSFFFFFPDPEMADSFRKKTAKKIDSMWFSYLNHIFHEYFPFEMVSV